MLRTCKVPVLIMQANQGKKTTARQSVIVDRPMLGLAGESRTARIGLIVLGLGVCGLSGCASNPGLVSYRERAIAEAAGPILRLDPNANWTECYNILVAHGAHSVSYLCTQPAMTRTAPPDSLSVLIHTSLVRLISNPATRPRLSANCLETSHDLLHFELKVRGRAVGDIAIPGDKGALAWTDLYPAAFDHALGAEINVERDRAALRAWYLRYAGSPAMLATSRRLTPETAALWDVLSLRRADAWEYAVEPEKQVMLTSSSGHTPGVPPRMALLECPTFDYNLTRAACIWLGSRPDAGVQRQLIELVGHPFDVVAGNARFALGFSPDPRIRALLRREIPETGEEPELELIARALHRNGRSLALFR
jgi:hypothetical protein